MCFWTLFLRIAMTAFKWLLTRRWIRNKLMVPLVWWILKAVIARFRSKSIARRASNARHLIK